MNKKANLSLVILSVVALFALGGIAIMYNGGATGAAPAQTSVRVITTAMGTPGLTVADGTVSTVTLRPKGPGPFTLEAETPLGDNVINYVLDGGKKTLSTGKAVGIKTQTSFLGIIIIVPEKIDPPVPILNFLEMGSGLSGSNGVIQLPNIGLRFYPINGRYESDPIQLPPDVKIIPNYIWPGILPGETVAVNMRVEQITPLAISFNDPMWAPNPANVLLGDWFAMINQAARQITVLCNGPGLIQSPIVLNSGGQSFFRLDTPGLYQCTETLSSAVLNINVA